MRPSFLFQMSGGSPKGVFNRLQPQVVPGIMTIFELREGGRQRPIDLPDSVWIMIAVSALLALTGRSVWSFQDIPQFS